MKYQKNKTKQYISENVNKKKNKKMNYKLDHLSQNAPQTRLLFPSYSTQDVEASWFDVSIGNGLARIKRRWLCTYCIQT